MYFSPVSIVGGPTDSESIFEEKKKEDKFCTC